VTLIRRVIADMHIANPESAAMAAAVLNAIPTALIEIAAKPHERISAAPARNSVEAHLLRFSAAC
jgi:hypothetical protein